MTTLKVGLLGLDRMGTSFGLALKQYAKTSGKYEFIISGTDTRSANEKAAHKMGAIDRIERTPEAVVSDAQIVLMNLPYDEVKRTYRQLRSSLREGVVILDASPLKTPSQEWGKELADKDVHIVGFTPLPASRYLESAGISAQDASADYFENAPCLIVPSVESAGEAIDLAYNVTYLLGGKPRFVDASDYDNMLAQVEQLPRLLGIAMLYHLTRGEGWQDMRYFTGSALGLATATVGHKHADALREEFYGSREVLAASLDQMVTHLGEIRDLLRQGDRGAIEDLLTTTSENYSAWQTARELSNWDKNSTLPAADNGGILSMMVGDRLAKRISGKK